MSNWLRSAAGAAVAGAGIWTLTEYAAHRWALHPNDQHRIDVSAPHTLHHQQPAVTRPVHRLGGIVGIAAVARLASEVVPPAAALAWAAGYVLYDAEHWALHHRAPRTRLGRELRIRHLRHHFGRANENLGVTTSVWDRLFGTESVDQPIRIPRRHAPGWLLATEDERLRSMLVVA